MKGNKWRLFCLEMSFLGWILLSGVILWIALLLLIVPAMVAGIGGMIVSLVLMFIVMLGYGIGLTLWLTPYMETSVAVFYREIKDGKYSNPQVEASAEEFTFEEAPGDTVTVEDSTEV